jgi:K+-sensing histidine kinase KdpD
MKSYKPRHPKQIDYQAIAEAIVRMAAAYRAPYVSVIGYSEALLEGLSGELQETQQEDVAAIRVCGWEALGHLNDILDVMLLVSDEIEYNMQTLQVQTIINDVKRDLQRTHQTATKRVETVFNIEKDARVHADELRLRQVLLGLVGNALVTVENGKVVLKTSTTDTHLIITIRDACQLASEDDYTYFFEPSWVSRLESNHWRQMQWQTYLTDQFVRAFGGEVSVGAVPADDSLPAGTQITIELPLVTDNQQPSLENPASSDAQATGGATTEQ